MTLFLFGTQEYIILTISLVVILILLVLLFFLLRKKVLQRFALLRYFYPVIRKTAVYYDYYLINQLIVQLGNNDSLYIDHVLFGNKYIYVISDYLYKGTLTGKAVDAKWILKNKKGEEHMVDNPLLKNKNILQRLSLKTSIDHATFISITLVNPETKITDLNVNDSQNFIIDTRDFTKLVLKIEERDISPLNPEELNRRVLEFDMLNIRRQRGSKWPPKK